MHRRIITSLIILVIGITLAVAKPTRGAYPLTIGLAVPVHFLTPKGEDLVVSPWTYEVGLAESALRLTPSDEKGVDAIMIEAQETSRKESLHWPMVIPLPAEAWNKYILIMLLPDGKGYESVGSYSGVQSRSIGGSVSAQVQRFEQSYQTIVSLQKQKLRTQEQLWKLEGKMKNLRQQPPSETGDAEVRRLQLDLQQWQQELGQITQTFSNILKQIHEKSTIQNTR